MDRLCDPCADEYNNGEEGETVTLYVQSPEGRICLEGELCERHRANETLLLYLYRYGRTVTDYKLTIAGREGSGGRVSPSVIEGVGKPALPPPQPAAHSPRRKALTREERNQAPVKCLECEPHRKMASLSRASHAFQSHGGKVWEFQWEYPEHIPTEVCDYCLTPFPLGYDIERHKSTGCMADT